MRLDHPYIDTYPFQSSIFVRDWATSHWPEARPVALPEELPRLKALIREARARQEEELESGVVEAVGEGPEQI